MKHLETFITLISAKDKPAERPTPERRKPRE